MKLHSFFLILIATFLAFQGAFADEVKSEDKEITNFLGAAFELSQMTLKGGTISGNGIKVDFSHYFNDKLSLEVYLSTAINASSAVQSSYTGLGAYVYYTLSGNCCDLKKTVTYDGVPVLVEKNERNSSFQLGAGLDQFLLNGSKSVYSISGIGLGATYQFMLFGYHMKAAGRYSLMSANSETVNGLFFSIGVLFGL
jgi:hypothetical protein